MQLKALIQNLGVLDVVGPLNREIKGLAYDVRRVVPGSAFVATPTHLGDGHRQIEEALARGAVAIICQYNPIRRHRATCVEVRDSKFALAEAARAFYSDPSSRLKMIAVVGGPGRTTTAFVLKQVLESSGLKTGLIGSVRHEIGDRILPAGPTFPEGLEINSMLADMVKNDCAACILEMRREDLASRALSGVKLDAVVFANFGQAPGMLGKENLSEMVRTLQKMPLCQRQACAIINVDEPAGRSLLDSGSVEVHLTYGMREQAEIRATRIHLGNSETTFHMMLGGTEVHCTVPLVGRHNVYALLAAAGAALTLELHPARIAAGLNTLSPIPGNLEAIPNHNQFQVYVDGAAKPTLLGEVLQSVREITAGRVILVVGATDRTTARERFDLGKAAGESADLTILTADNPGPESSAEIAATIAQGIEQTRGVRFAFEADRTKAIMRALSLARPGDSVLIAGKGDRSFQRFADTIIPFDDRDCARECLESFVTEIPRFRLNSGIPVMA